MTPPTVPPSGPQQPNAHQPSAAVQVLWAKSGQKSEGEGWLPVLHHLLDVGACAQAILEREPPSTRALLAADFGTDTDTALRWTCALSALHDLGKASPAFQHKAEGLARQVWQVLPWQDHSAATPHGTVTQVLLPGLLAEHGWTSAASQRVAARIAQAIGCHHGQRDTRDRVPDRGTGEEWKAVQNELLTLVLQAFGLQDAPPPPIQSWSGEAFMRLAGLTSFADWVGSSFVLEGEPDPLPFRDPAAYLEQKLIQARAELDRIGWTVRQPLAPELRTPDETFAYLPSFAARPLQTLLAELLNVPSDRPALVLVEAPMGEGKTEAALYAHLQLQRAAGHRGLYVALPTQATGNAMYGRLRTFLGHQVTAGGGEAVTVDLQLLHGGAAMQGTYQADLERTAQAAARPNTQAPARSAEEQRLFPLPNEQKLTDEAESVRAAEWFSHRKRALLSEYGVGTVDQALLGVLNVNHQFVRLWGMGNRVVVLDEVHAYDTYTTQLIHALCRWLRALNSSVVLMSATLPDQTRRDLLNAWGVTPDAPPCYPRLTVARLGDAAPISRHIPGPRRNVKLRLRPLDPEVATLAAQAVTLAAQGGTVAVIVNTVQRAQQVFVAVRKLLGDRFQSMYQGSRHPERIGVHLYHARYPADERLDREERTLRYLGKQPATYTRKGAVHTEDMRPERFILIATQVAEQSLDFDADVMISDLAPIDLLLQRAGRLHRHAANEGRRGAHCIPTLYVAGLADWPKAALDAHKWKYIYAPALLYRSWYALQGRDTVALPDDLDLLVQRVYDPLCPALEGLTDDQERTLRCADRELNSLRRTHITTGGQAHIGEPDTFLELPVQPSRGEPEGEPVQDDPAATAGEEADEPRLGTRLGDESLRIVPLHRYDTVYLDAKGRETAQVATLRRDNWDLARKIYARSLQISRHDVIAALKANPTVRGNEHRGWAAHPLLRDAEPLELVNGEILLGKTRLRLDLELGLVYERLE
ncbi:CRISPR-associated helicase/endonuclease Cas3 [Deinococcus gobiensis]|uniref:CRISPR-associated helicase Cas3, core n=1 Tax=Deinococcus gobiensis (strain DSM 21396 / JCM 16679 / CGMCC 1.7299 / I-0) TaxID=745776 RepID=H8H3S0_DEIGI|nr:CRISPR-associated helicase/endonuclease Cas3 [Deinococcus gobiensis]AFD28167.1 CRISPR-associated helicase Cas3, core [Deinococcus gobiensis I-0]